MFVEKLCGLLENATCCICHLCMERRKTWRAKLPNMACRIGQDGVPSFSTRSG